MCEILLKLNGYQAANLRWALCKITDSRGEAASLLTGDWCGEILLLLEQEMIEKDATDIPPNEADYWPEFRGTCGGMKELDYVRWRESKKSGR